MPEVPPPEDLPDAIAPLRALVAKMPQKLPERVRRFMESPRPFEFRSVQEIHYLQPRKEAPARQVWFRAVGRLPDEQMLHRCLLAYVSDFFLLDTSTLPHGTTFLSPKLIMASIDHAMWFHRPLRVDEWLLYALDSPSASGARGFARASVFAGDGRLVASTAQEGLVRQV
jgi:acyl-CoA thioesterase II